MGFLGGLGNMISENPEKFSIMADMLGQGFDPDNAFAGIGTAMGQSSLANKALAEEKKTEQDWREMIAGMISGQVPVTTPGKSGVSGATIKPSKDGGANEITVSLTEPTDRKKMTDRINMGDLVSNPF